jgi:hypothetical protein
MSGVSSALSAGPGFDGATGGGARAGDETGGAAKAAMSTVAQNKAAKTIRNKARALTVKPIRTGAESGLPNVRKHDIPPG